MGTGSKCTVVLSRHGQTVWHHENRYAGTSDIELTDTGREQVQALAVWAARARPEAVVCSPVRRARETAAPAAGALGLELFVDDDLREVSFGVAEGRTLAELDPAVVERFRSDPVTDAFPGAESMVGAATRGAAALVRTAARHPGETVLVVAHNTLLRLALCDLLGIELRRYRAVFPRLDNGSLTTLRLVPEGSVSLISLNVPL